MGGGARWAAVYRVARSRTGLSDFTFIFHFHALEKKMATHSSVLAWRIPGTGEPGGLPSLGSHRVGYDWSDLAAAADKMHARRELRSACSISDSSRAAMVWGLTATAKWGTDSCTLHAHRKGKAPRLRACLGCGASYLTFGCATLTHTLGPPLGCLFWVEPDTRTLGRAAGFISNCPTSFTVKSSRPKLWNPWQTEMQPPPSSHRRPQGQSQACSVNNYTVFANTATSQLGPGRDEMSDDGTRDEFATWTVWLNYICHTTKCNHRAACQHRMEPISMRSGLNTSRRHVFCCRARN